jgi:hypothetical protein
VNDSAVEQLLTNWNSLPLNDDQRMQLTRPFTWDEISKASRRSPRKSSPGSDGLPYEVLGILLRLPFLRPLVLQVYNEALEHAFFPESGLYL